MVDPKKNEEIGTYLHKLHEMLPDLKKRYPVSYMGIFGSVVRGEQTSSSDLDILVEFNGTITLLGYARLEEELSQAFGVRVDLVSKNALKPRIGRHILAEVVEA
ncbi:hypothetical protein SAMN04488587_0917 [Methanococcoides vulcani]|uniref:protein adenylyltransferase n=1 Tax=Methanococcoides vulcani TaxID=1353158 RepID=A0A1H9Z7M5_9EURY|nr:nucleotidyltransferase family protein [Methanococcoides vulcani]SES77505.1 hypothetical protein SAMN04488587_0917 [Methanococcoides vulcani]